MLRMTLLGVGTAVPDQDRENTHMVWEGPDGLLLIDAGGSTYQRLLRAGLDPLRLRGVFLTHSHADHVNGLPALLFQLSLAGFAGALPIYGNRPTLDLMRRLPDAANGIIELLVARTVAELDQRGVRRLSLNFAAFSRLLDDDVQHTRVDRLLRRVVDVLNPYYQIRSLREFNEKFQPEWQPRSLIYADPGDLPKVALRYAFLEGFVDVPLIGRLLSGPSEGGAIGPR